MNFDAYTLKARLAPGLLVLLPLIAVLLAWFPNLATLPGLSALSAFAVAVGTILAFQVREEGLKLQRRLFEEWGAAPTTMLLRHGDSRIGALDKARYHNTVQKMISELTVPDAEKERADPLGADEIYETVTAWLRERTRDRSKFPVVASENENYGFHRNLCALRTMGLISSGVSACGSLVLAAIQPGLPAIASIAVSISSGLVFLLHAKAASVRRAAVGYAIALIRAVDALEKKS